MVIFEQVEGIEQFDAAAFNQDGSFIQCGHREECEQAAQAAAGLYCYIVDGRPVIRTDFERDE